MNVSTQGEHESLLSSLGTQNGLRPLELTALSTFKIELKHYIGEKPPPGKLYPATSMAQPTQAA
ncbi:MAG: hypothetical protein M3O33_18260 [Cyanobacteriota bacterium]|nr:hypothetical protein [Cyanobacteriota bacterium]